MWLGLLWILLLAGIWVGYGLLARGHDLKEPLTAISAAAANDRWDDAAVKAEALMQRWQRARTVTELVHGGSLIAEFELDLARMRGAIAAQDHAAVSTEIAGLMEQWDGLQSSFPDGK